MGAAGVFFVLWVLGLGLADRCPDEWLEFEGKCYLLREHGRSWMQCLAACDEASDKSTLACPAGPGEAAFAWERLVEPFGSPVWVGLTDMIDEGNWRCASDADAAPAWSAWAPGEPGAEAPDADEDCVALGDWQGAAGSWKSSDCEDRRACLCEAPLSLDGAFESVLRKGQELDEDQLVIVGGAEGHAYVLFAKEQTWNQAKENCEDGGGDLTSIEDAETQAALATLMQKAGVEEAWVGGQDRGREGEWLWVEDRVRLHKMDYEPPWCQGLWGDEPNGGFWENCLAMRAGGKGCWFDQNCARKRPFFCKYAAAEGPNAATDDAPARTWTQGASGASCHQSDQLVDHEECFQIAYGASSDDGKRSECWTHCLSEYDWPLVASYGDAGEDECCCVAECFCLEAASQGTLLAVDARTYARNVDECEALEDDGWRNVLDESTLDAPLLDATGLLSCEREACLEWGAADAKCCGAAGATGCAAGFARVESATVCYPDVGSGAARLSTCCVAAAETGDAAGLFFSDGAARDYAAAAAYCEARDTSVASIASAAEEAGALASLRANGIAAAWLGAEPLHTEWVWRDGSAAAYLRFKLAAAGGFDARPNPGSTTRAVLGADAAWAPAAAAAQYAVLCRSRPAAAGAGSSKKRRAAVRSWRAATIALLVTAALLLALVAGCAFVAHKRGRSPLHAFMMATAGRDDDGFIIADSVELVGTKM